MRRRTLLALLIMLIGAFALLAAGCGGDDEGAADEAPAADTGAAGGDEEQEAEGGTVKVVSDLPLQGAAAGQTETMVNAIQLYLDQVGSQAGAFTVEYESWDDSTAARGAWDEAVCADNARKYVEDESILGVIGTFNSGCAKIMVPILNEGGIAMVSPANTAVGLTHEGPGSEPGEPEKYYPTGERNYTRVVASDDFQGEVDANYMKDDLGVTRVFILDDKDAYGKGVADAFEIAANEIGLEVAGHEGWDANAQNYRALMEKIADTGADGIFIGGISDFNGGQVVKDKVAIVGDNEAVKLVVSDGFVTASLFEEAGPENLEGAFGSAPVLNPEDITGAGAEFLDAYEAEYGAPEVYTAYAAAATQALLDAIGRSDGSRADVIAKLFETDISDGIVGPMAFDENGDPRERLISIFEAQDGEWAFVQASQIGG